MIPSRLKTSRLAAICAPARQSARRLARLGCLGGLLFALLVSAASGDEVHALTRHQPVRVLTALTRLRQQGQITSVAFRRYAASLSAASTEIKALSPTRARELEAVVTNIRSITSAGLLTASRLPALFLTLDRNRQWWRRGPLLSYGQRVEFAGSQLVWEFYPGQGIELQVLGSFGKAQWMCAAGGRYANRCRSLLAELIPLAARRAGGLTWEYYFDFDGGVPPWTSAMSQGTALQTLADAYRSLRDPLYLGIGERALAVFRRPPPAGVAVQARHGTRYLQYSFAAAPPRQRRQRLPAKPDRSRRLRPSQP